MTMGRVEGSGMTIDLWTTETRTKFPGVWREARTSNFFGPYGLFRVSGSEYK